MSEYTHPDVLVTTNWVADHLNDPNVRLIEADEDVLLYEIGHIPGAVKLNWHVDVQDPLSRDFIDHKGLELLFSRWGITNDTTIVLYSDRNNWYAAYAFWLFKQFGHKSLKLLERRTCKMGSRRASLYQRHSTLCRYHLSCTAS